MRQEIKNKYRNTFGRTGQDYYQADLREAVKVHKESCNYAAQVKFLHAEAGPLSVDDVMPGLSPSFESKVYTYVSRPSVSVGNTVLVTVKPTGDAQVAIAKVVGLVPISEARRDPRVMSGDTGYVLSVVTGSDTQAHIDVRMRRKYGEREATKRELDNRAAKRAQELAKEARRTLWGRFAEERKEKMAAKAQQELRDMLLKPSSLVDITGFFTSLDVVDTKEFIASIKLRNTKAELTQLVKKAREAGATAWDADEAVVDKATEFLTNGGSVEEMLRIFRSA